MECEFYENCNHCDCEKDFCPRQYKLTYLYDAAKLGRMLRQNVALYPDQDQAHSDIEVFKRLKAIEHDIVNYVQAGKNIYIYSGQCGNGKTSWSVKLLKAYLNRIWAKSGLECKALYVNVPKFLQSVKDSFSNYNELADYIKANIQSADLVVFDELGDKISSDFDLDFLLSIIDTRISEGKTNIYTSNLGPMRLMQQLGERLYSRIYNYSEVFEFKGADKRNMAKNGGMQ